MQFTDFPEANLSFRKPETMTDDQCGTLRVQRGTVDLAGDKFQVSISAWKPDAEDLKRLNNGGLIYLTVYGTSHPPVGIDTVKRKVIEEIGAPQNPPKIDHRPVG